MGSNWTQTTPSSAIWQASDLAYSARIDTDLSSDPTEQAYLLSLQAAAVEYAETAMGTSLITRTITAKFYGPSNPYYFGYEYGSTWLRNKIVLPRGPIQSITSVTDANGVISAANYALEGAGTKDYLRFTVGWIAPLTVVYQAGYGSSAASVPADIANAIRTHVGTLYEHRESAEDRTILPVPHSLEAFYQRKSRNIQVG